MLPTKKQKLVNAILQDPLTCVKYDVKGAVAVITMSRPEFRNAWTEIMRNEVDFATALKTITRRPQIARCLDDASRDPRVRVTIITGDPAGKSFCAGADLSPSSADNPTSIMGDVPEGRVSSVHPKTYTAPIHIPNPIAIRQPILYRPKVRVTVRVKVRGRGRVRVRVAEEWGLGPCLSLILCRFQAAPKFGDRGSGRG